MAVGNPIKLKMGILTQLKWITLHCVKSVRICSYSRLHFPAFGLNTDRHSISLSIQSECGKMWTRKTSNRDTFHAVLVFTIFKFIVESICFSAKSFTSLWQTSPLFDSLLICLAFIFSYKQPESAAIFPNKKFRQKIYLSFPFVKRRYITSFLFEVTN